MSQPSEQHAWSFEEIHQLAYLMRLEQAGEANQVATLILANRNLEAKTLARTFFDESIRKRIKILAPAK